METRPSKGRIQQEGKQLKHVREPLDIPLDDHPIITQIRTRLPFPVTTGSEVIFPFITLFFTHTHRHIIQLQYVALYDAYLLLVLIDILCQMASVYYDMP